MNLVDLIPEETYIDFTDYRDELSDDILSALLSGETIDWEQHDDWIMGVEFARRDYAQSDVDDILSSNDIDKDELDWDDYDELVSLYLDRDKFDWFDTLLRNTPDQLLRVNISDTLSDDLDGFDTVENREAIIREALAAHGATISDDALSYLLDNGPYHWHEGVRLDVIFCASVADFQASDTPKSVTFHSPYILLGDSFNGSGMDVDLSSDVTVVIGPDNRVFRDKDISGYSWTDTAGPYEPAYRVDYTFNE